MNNGSSPAAIDDVLSPLNEQDGVANEQTASNGIPIEAIEDELPPVDAKKLHLEALREFLKDLQVMLDSLVYLELSAIYYMDASTLCLFLRGMVQFIYLTPKPAHLPVPRATSRLGAIIGVSLLCIWLHILRARPEAGEATQGYLHGSIIIDFIGQRGPTSKLHLLALDVLVALLQLVGLALYLGLKAGSDVLSQGVPDIREQDPAITTRQTLDFEEQGLLRSTGVGETDDDIELREMRRSVDSHQALPNEDDEENYDHETEAFLSNQEARARRQSLHALDASYSGRVIVADFCLVKTVMEQYLEFRNAVHSSS